jgi:hypothetical protein
MKYIESHTIILSNEPTVTTHRCGEENNKQTLITDNLSGIYKLLIRILFIKSNS